jgi:hypothetical protein
MKWPRWIFRRGFSFKENLMSESEFPKWVTPDPSHIVSHNGHQLVHEFEFHQPRDGILMVLVHDADEEARALSEKA